MRSKCVVLAVTRVIRPAISTRRYCFNEERCWLKPRKLEDRSFLKRKRILESRGTARLERSLPRKIDREQAETRRATILLRTARLYSFDSVTNIDRQTDGCIESRSCLKKHSRRVAWVLLFQRRSFIGTVVGLPGITKIEWKAMACDATGKVHIG